MSLHQEASLWPLEAMTSEIHHFDIRSAKCPPAKTNGFSPFAFLAFILISVNTIMNISNNISNNNNNNVSFLVMVTKTFFLLFLSTQRQFFEKIGFKITAVCLLFYRITTITTITTTTCSTPTTKAKEKEPFPRKIVLRQPQNSRTKC